MLDDGSLNRLVLCCGGDDAYAVGRFGVESRVLLRDMHLPRPLQFVDAGEPPPSVMMLEAGDA